MSTAFLPSAAGGTPYMPLPGQQQPQQPTTYMPSAAGGGPAPSPWQAPTGFDSPLNTTVNGMPNTTVTAPGLNQLVDPQVNAGQSGYFASPEFLAQQAYMMAQSYAADPSLYQNRPETFMSNSGMTAQQYKTLLPEAGANVNPADWAGPNTAANANWQQFLPGGQYYNLTQQASRTPGAMSPGLMSGVNDAYKSGNPTTPVNWNDPAHAATALFGGPGTPSMFGSGGTGDVHAQPYNPFQSPPSTGDNAGNFNNLFSMPQAQSGMGPMYAPSSGSGAPNPGAAFGMTPDQYMAYGIANGGNPIDTTPAWQAMVQAEGRNNSEQFANLNEAFNVNGGRFSRAYGTAATDFWNQAALNQNAQLTAAQTASLESGQNRASSWLSQLSGQEFQSQMQQQAQAGQMAQSLFGQSANAAGQLNNGAIQGAMGMFGAENAAGMSQAQLAMALQQMGLSGATNLSQLWQSNLGVGSQIGGQQYSQQQNSMNNLYQEFLRQQPQNNPLLSLMYSIATGYPQLTNSGYQPSSLGSLLGGLGGLLGGVSMLSDRRLKENEQPISSWVADHLGLTAYKYNFIGDPTERTGFMAQDVQEKYPEAVVEHPSGYLGVDYGALLTAMA